MWTLFRKAGFQTYLVDEFRTSYKCSKCERGSCIKMMVIKNPRPYRTENIIFNWLICCKNRCGYWNRDVNGATNIYKIAYNEINNKRRPNYLSRKKEFINWFRRASKTKIYMLWNKQTLLILSGVCPIYTLQGCKDIVDSRENNCDPNISSIQSFLIWLYGFKQV